jgi:hypothetical protein
MIVPSPANYLSSDIFHQKYGKVRAAPILAFSRQLIYPAKTRGHASFQSAGFMLFPHRQAKKWYNLT